MSKRIVNLLLMSGVLFLDAMLPGMHQQPKTGNDWATKRPIDKKLFEAVEAGDLNAVRCALAGGATVDAIDETMQGTPLLVAAGLSNESIVSELLDRGANPQVRGLKDVTALHFAAGNGHSTIVRLLLDRGVHPDVANQENARPLHLAAALGNEATVRVLLDRGANVNAGNKSGKTPLNIAVTQGRTMFVPLQDIRPAGQQEATIRLLLDRGADVNLDQNNGATPLHWAVIYNLENIVTLLLDRGADIEAIGSEGETALRLAIAGGNENLVRLLVQRGAVVTNAHVDFATESNEPGIANILRDHVGVLNRAAAAAASSSLTSGMAKMCVSQKNN